MNILGIDSGLNGGIVLLSNGIIAEKWIMPTIEEDDYNVFDPYVFRDFLKILPGNTVMFLEKVSAYAMSQSTAFNYGITYGQTDLICRQSGLKLNYVRPSAWSKEIHQGIDKKIKAKEKSLIALKKIFPDADLRATERSKKQHEGLVDALLIAEFGRRLLTKEREFSL